MKCRSLLAAVAGIALAAAGGRAQDADVFLLQPKQAEVWVQGQKIDTPQVQTDALAPGVSLLRFPAGAPLKTQVRWSCANVPPGDYHLRLAVPGRTFLEFGDLLLPGRLHLFHNNTRLPWTGHGPQSRVTSALSSQFPYWAELTFNQPVRIRTNDTLRVIWMPQDGEGWVGPLCLQRTRFTNDVSEFSVAPAWDQGSKWATSKYGVNPEELWIGKEPWLEYGWEDADQTACWLYNPGTDPLPVRLEARARDWFERPLLDIAQERVLEPGERCVVPLAFEPGATPHARLFVRLMTGGGRPEWFLVKYVIPEKLTGPRSRLNLNGTWQMCQVQALELGPEPAKDAKWEPVEVPSLQGTANGHCAWYRRELVLPPEIRGERYVLQFDQVLSECRVYVNGKECAYERFPSEPFEVDITAALEPDATNELWVAARDWLAFSPANQERVRQGKPPRARYDLTTPVGYVAMGYWGGSLGIGGPVWLETRPALAVDDVFAVSDVAAKRLTLHVRITNRGDAEQTAQLVPSVLDRGAPVLRLPRTSISLGAGASTTLVVQASWPGVKCWEPGNPHLYVLQSELKPANGAADRHLLRFGFRDVTIQDTRFLVNQVPVKIRSFWAGASSHGYSSSDPAATPAKRRERMALRQLEALYNADVQLSRTHNCVGLREVCEVADETGLMLKPENGNFCQQVFTPSPAYWANAETNQLRWLDAYKNHPSACIWSAGNENNLWNWYYQGAEAFEEGSRRQLELTRAMAAADLQQRPLEWEADADLFGQWNYYALHYARELPSHTDLPVGAWWGPLDGRTTVRYVGTVPVVLGSKPLTIGESGDPSLLRMPLGATVVRGDAAFLGGAQQWRGWYEANAFLIQGLRDAEFALVDSYHLPKLVLPAQAIVLKDETCSFFGGSRVSRTLNIHNDTGQPTTLALRWSLTDENGRTLASGSRRLRFQPAELRREQISLALPSVAHIAPAVFCAELRSGPRLLHVVERRWTLHPQPLLNVPAALNLTVFDPSEETAADLRKAGVPFALTESLTPPEKGALLIGRDALRQAPQGAWRDELLSFVRDGGRLVILEQPEAPDFLPIPLALNELSQSTLSWLRAADHPMMEGIEDADLRWWMPDHYVSQRNYRKPVSGNWLPLVDVGTPDGLTETPLLELYEGRGSILLCQMPIFARWNEAPPAAWLAQNLLAYLALPAPFRTLGRTALLTGTSKTLEAALQRAGLVYNNLAGQPSALTPDRFSLAVAHASVLADPAIAAALSTFAREGGRVLMLDAQPDQQAALERLLELPLSFHDVAQEPSDAQYRVRRNAPCAEELSGISNQEFFWPTQAYLQNNIRGLGSWWSSFEPVAEPDRVADFFVEPAADSPTAMALTEPSALLRVALGRGSVTLCQLRVDRPPSDAAATAQRLLGLLLTNLGATLQVQDAAEARARRYRHLEFFTIDLGPFAQRGLVADPTNRIVGWTDQGDNDLRGFPVGRQNFGGVPFFIAHPKSAVMLRSPAPKSDDLPEQVRIPIGRHARHLFFLHTAAWCSSPHPFRYRVLYADGSAEELPMRNRHEVYDWWDDPANFEHEMARSGAFVAWRGSNPQHSPISVACYEWFNPHPDREILAVEFLPSKSDPDTLPILLGLTGATEPDNVGVVEDVIGTAGVRVRLESGPADVYYIGAEPLPSGHPYHAQAVAAHRALVVGKKVSLRNDAVTQNARGQRIAYVFLGDEEAVPNLVNARVIADGLSKASNFEGNTRYSVYLQNLELITRQNRKGLWAFE